MEQRTEINFLGEEIMEQFLVFIDKLSETSGIKATTLHQSFKALAAIVGSYIVWFILKRILMSIEKKTKSEGSCFQTASLSIDIP